MIRSLYYDPAADLRTDLTIDEIAAIVKSGNGLLWVDFEGNPPEQDEPILRDVFGFHPLAIDDALQESHVPKLDDWTQYLYIVLHAIIFNKDSDQYLDTLELDIFLGEHYMVTHHDQQISAVERTWTSAQKDHRHLVNGADHLLYRLVDEVVSSYMPVVEELDEEIDLAENQIFDNPTSQTLEKLFTLKRATLHLRRVISPQREVLNKLARDDYPVIDVRARIYFRDVYDHLVRLTDLSESIRDLVGGALETYLSVINNRMNEIMKTLTVITTLFMPISFIASFFGMNFFTPSTPLDVWTGKPAYVIVLIITFLTPISIYAWVRRRGWM